MLSVTCVRHNIEVQRFDVREREYLSFGLIADSGRVHEETLSHAVSLVEVASSRPTDGCHLVDADFELVGFERVIQALVDESQVDALQYV